MNVEQVAVAELEEHPANPRQGDVGAIVESIQQNGWYGTIVAQRSTRQVLVGNHRLKAAHALEMSEVPVMWVDVDDETALRILLADNRTSDLASYDDQALANLLTDLAQQTESALAGTGYSGDDLDSLLADLAMPPVEDIPPGIPKPNSRKSRLELIFSCAPGSITLSRLGYSSGWRIGCTSGWLQGDDRSWQRYITLDFIDNPWHGYDHENHRRIVAELRPKYATVRDVLTKSQAEEAGVEWYSLEQILDWAAEFEELCEQVIVIPKYDCLDKIPERYVLGYSVPSSYGRTMLPPEAFAGRRTHLLGGSWKIQLSVLNILGDDAVSLDNNNIILLSEFGQFVTRNGESRHISETLGEPNSYYTALAASLTNIALKAQELYPVEDAGIEPIPDQEKEPAR